MGIYKVPSSQNNSLDNSFLLYNRNGNTTIVIITMWNQKKGLNLGSDQLNTAYM